MYVCMFYVCKSLQIRLAFFPKVYSTCIWDKRGGIAGTARHIGFPANASAHAWPGLASSHSLS